MLLTTNYNVSDFQEDSLRLVLYRTGYGRETSNYSITWDHKFFKTNTTYVFSILPTPLNMAASLVLEITDNITVTLQNNVSYNVTIAACPYRSPVTEFDFSKINIIYFNCTLNIIICIYYTSYCPLPDSDVLIAYSLWSNGTQKVSTRCSNSGSHRLISTCGKIEEIFHTLGRMCYVNATSNGR